jgi:hypothetical protein
MIASVISYILWAILLSGLSFLGYVIGHKDGYKTGYGNGRRAGQLLSKSARS